MTAEELKAIRERLEKVDPWPWNWIAPGPGSRYGSITNAVRGIEARFEGNGPFIAHAPADVSALLSDLDCCRRELDARRATSERAIALLPPGMTLRETVADLDRSRTEIAALRRGIAVVLDRAAKGEPVVAALAALVR
jgi:hypothetical protein